MNTTQAAEFLGVNDSRIRQLVRDKELPATKVGRDWIIERKALERYRKTLLDRNQGKRGRPFKA